MTIIPKVIFIDWYKTLSNSLFWSQLEDKGHKYHAFHAQISKWLFVENNALINSWMRGEFTCEEICEKMGAQIGLDSSILFEELKVSCENMKFVSDELPDLIQKLRSKGFNVSIATDNMDTFSRFTVQALGLDKLFDDILVSNELHCLKQDVKIDRIPFFEEFIKENNLQYKNIVLLDDHIDETGTYEKLGLVIRQIIDAKNLIIILNEYSA